MIKNGWHQTKFRVRYKDTDCMGVVYYGNYLTFFETGRTEMLRELGFPYSNLESEGYRLPVTEAFARYHGNVGYDAQIIISTAIANVSKIRVQFNYRIHSEEDILLVEGHTVHACINSDMKPSRIPDKIKAVLEENKLIEATD
ncbi:MAG: acyl-CoA thioesterase [Deltaproteobacteria bacterium]|nr:acyl-CoA thioesterase [Deltaproteobacteria bacterium]